MEKLAFCLVHSSRKLRPYFQAHPIHVLTNQPLRQVVELGQFEITYHPRATKKAQALADFIAECTRLPEENSARELPECVWHLFVDGSSNEHGSGAGIILVTPDGYRIHSALRFGFEASNNEALLAGLRLAKELGAKAIRCFSDSQLLVNQVLGEYQARGLKMEAYLLQVQKQLQQFEYYSIEQVPREQNSNADALARLATTKEADTLNVVPVEFLPRPSINVEENEEANMELVDTQITWMTPLVDYLTTGSPLLIRVRQGSCFEEAQGILKEVHEGFCGDHTGGDSLAKKIIRQGYYWPTISQDSLQYGGVKYAVVAVDYFKKWAEAEPLATITSKKVLDFFVKNILCRYGVPQTIVSDNGKQFDNDLFSEFCKKNGIVKSFASVAHPQANGQVEVVNKTLKTTLKKRLEAAKGRWPEELPQVLWSYRTSHRTATGNTPYSLTYGSEAMVPVETQVPSHRNQCYEQHRNHLLLEEALDLLDERREDSQLRNAAHQQRVKKYYDSRVRGREFIIGDLVLRRVFLATRDPTAGVLGPNWEGPYQIETVLRP
ncbi:uncharacterized protein LOC133038471 [Cannabis sativa]|uniref:uncharacterized protein LOC133038471 n=1 Tax=Cannabis sativa TaxID=3483 RepID=UPI0029C9D52B|nr:uncharacterized protein LOC133038471 [Cannabis sativa]